MLYGGVIGTPAGAMQTADVTLRTLLQPQGTQRAQALLYLGSLKLWCHPGQEVSQFSYGSSLCCTGKEAPTDFAALRWRRHLRRRWAPRRGPHRGLLELTITTTHLSASCPSAGCALRHREGRGSSATVTAMDHSFSLLFSLLQRYASLLSLVYSMRCSNSHALCAKHNEDRNANMHPCQCTYILMPSSQRSEVCLLPCGALSMLHTPPHQLLASLPIPYSPAHTLSAYENTKACHAQVMYTMMLTVQAHSCGLVFFSTLWPSLHGSASLLCPLASSIHSNHSCTLRRLGEAGSHCPAALTPAGSASAGSAPLAASCCSMCNSTRALLAVAASAALGTCPTSLPCHGCCMPWLPSLGPSMRMGDVPYDVAGDSCSPSRAPHCADPVAADAAVVSCERDAAAATVAMDSGKGDRRAAAVSPPPLPAPRHAGDSNRSARWPGRGGLPSGEPAPTGTRGGALGRIGDGGQTLCAPLAAP